jgi:HK97 gp10 family phage protein
MSDAKDLEALVQNFTKAKREVRNEVNKDLAVTAAEVQQQMQQYAPVDTGYLRSQIRVQERSPGQVAIGPVNVHYALAQEYGSRPHTITAKPGKTLAWRGKDGQMKYAKSVRHPGNRPQPYIRPAGDWARQALPKRIVVTGASLIEGRDA